MKHGSLFSGGGGFDLAAETMEWQNIFHCERDEFCQRILKFYWPDTALYSDIKEFDGTVYHGQIDVLTGGFPCQPFSAAGQRRGTADDRYLWPEMYRIIKQVKPRWVVAENAYGIISWDKGLVLQTVQSDLAAEGYEIWPYVLPAAGIGAPHQRYRVFIVAFQPGHAATGYKETSPDANSIRRQCPGARPMPAQRRNGRNDFKVDGLRAAQLPQVTTNAYGQGLEGRSQHRGAEKSRQKALKRFARLCKRSPWKNWPAQSPVCGGNDGLPPNWTELPFQNGDSNQ